MRNTLGFVLVIATAAAVSAQQVVVDPAGGGHYKDLQAALDKSPSGAVIQVRGGTYGPLVIRRSVTILGNPAPRIRSTVPPPSTGGVQPPAIQLKGSGQDTLTLVAVTIQDTPQWGWNLLGAGIEGTGFRRVRIERSIVEAMRWGTTINGAALSAPAIRLRGAPTLVLTASAVRANDAQIYGCDYFFANLSGAPGIDSDGTVIVVGGRVAGGNGANLCFSTAPSTNPCPCAFTGAGGTGVVAPAVYATPGTLFGGRGGTVYVMYPQPPRPWGKQPDGRPSSVPVQSIRDDMTRSSPMGVGKWWSVMFPARCRGGLLAVGLPAPGPIPLGPDLLFVDPSWAFLVFGIARCATTFTIRLPGNPAIAGISLAAQIADFGVQRLSTPLLDTVGY